MKYLKFTTSNRFSYLVYILIITTLFLSCSDDKQRTTKSLDSLDTDVMPDQVSKDIKVIFVDSSFTKAILTAKRARVYQKRMETLLDGGLKVDFMNRETGKRMSVLTADSARIDDKTKNMLARGNVVVISDSSNTRLETSLLEWNNSTQKFYSTEFVKITSPQERLQGWGFESDPNLSNYRISKVSGETK